MSDDFYIFLTSNVKNAGAQQNNTISKFITNLPEKLELSEDYEVALADISYTKSWFNIDKPEEIVITDFYSTLISYKIILPPGIYNESTVVKAINLLIKKHGIEDWIFQNPELIYDEKINKIKIRFGYLNNPKIVMATGTVLPIFSYNLSEKLGFIDNNSQKMDSKNYKKFCPFTDGGDRVPILYSNLNPQINSIHSLYLYSDILNPRIVGNEKAPLLRKVEIPEDVDFGQDVFIKYQNLFYHPLNHFEIDNILIYMKDDKGKDVELKVGRVTISLHFRKTYKIDKNLIKF